MGRDPAPGPGPPRFWVGCQLHLPDLSPMPGHPPGATRQTHAPLRTHWRSAGGGSTSYDAGQDSHLGEPPGGVGPLSSEVTTHATGAGKTMDAQAQPPGGLELRPHHAALRCAPKGAVLY